MFLPGTVIRVRDDVSVRYYNKDNGILPGSYGVIEKVEGEFWRVILNPSEKSVLMARGEMEEANG